MRFWFAEDPARLARERAELEELAAQSDWLVAGGWSLSNGGDLAWTAEIIVAGVQRKFTLQYSRDFPYAPPSIFPADRSERWSTHQYQSGELCLEYGTDNWRPEISGAQIVQSLHRLLSVEQGDSSQAPRVAPSRHKVTSGQEARGSALRFLATRAFVDHLSTVSEGETLAGEIRCHRLTDDSWIDVARSIKSAEGSEWTDPSIPREIDYCANGFPLRMICLPLSTPLPPLDLDLFRAAVQPYLEGFPQDEDVSHFLFKRGDRIDCFWLGPKTAYKVFVIHEERQQSRLPSSHGILAAKSVAIVGCGSLGSKVATMMARSGVGSFLLVDDDVLLPGNLVRNDLDWTLVGAHKAGAVKTRLGLISPTITVDISHQRLGGQESGNDFGILLKKLAQCDLIIDATADAQAFNILNIAAIQHKRSFLWASVYAGGIGGVVARHRPEIDPLPYLMRDQIEQWWRENDPDPTPQAAHDYGLETGTGTLIGSDPEVGVIASHAASMGIDLLLQPAESNFLYSVYLIGLKKARAFHGPFDTIPITVSGATQFPKDVASPDDVNASASFFADILVKSLEITRPKEPGA